jgi:uncharacterized protein (DUF1778 family)
MPERNRGKRLSGSEKMKLAGKKAVMLTMSPEDKILLMRAARAQGRSVSGFVCYHALMSARAVLGGHLFPDPPTEGGKQ